MEKKKFPGMAIILSIVALAAIAVAIFVIFKFVINDPESPVDAPVNAASITQNANLTNWGFACEIDGEMYYSDHKTGIYVAKESGEELYLEGRYSDLCDLGDKLFCVEYFYKQTDDNNIIGAITGIIYIVFVHDLYLSFFIRHLRRSLRTTSQVPRC